MKKQEIINEIQLKLNEIFTDIERARINKESEYKYWNLDGKVYGLIYAINIINKTMENDNAKKT